MKCAYSGRSPSKSVSGRLERVVGALRNKSVVRGRPDSSPDPPDPRDELVEHLPFLRAIALSFVSDAHNAEDLAHTTFRKAWLSLARFEPGMNMKAWLYTILRNTHYSQLRNAWREVSDTDGRAAMEQVEAPAHDGRLVFSDFLAAFHTLPRDQRIVLLLVGAHGYTYEEAAKMCDCAVGTVKSRINRGRRKVGSLLHFDAQHGVLIEDKMKVTIQSGQRRTC